MRHAVARRVHYGEQCDAHWSTVEGLPAHFHTFKDSDVMRDTTSAGGVSRLRCALGFELSHRRN